MAHSTTDRRSFLKSGALVAAPLAVAAPAAVIAGDGAQAKLARLEDERAIEALHRAFLRRVNGSGDCGELVAKSGAIRLEDGLRAIADDPADDGELTLAQDGHRAVARRPVTIEIDTEFSGHGTLEQMARFQGHGSHRRREARVLTANYVKGRGGWQIASLRLV